MNWKFEAIEKLKEYTARKNSITSIPEEIRRRLRGNEYAEI